jgi:hypothetical protein
MITSNESYSFIFISYHLLNNLYSKTKPLDIIICRKICDVCFRNKVLTRHHAFLLHAQSNYYKLGIIVVTRHPHNRSPPLSSRSGVNTNRLKPRLHDSIKNYGGEEWM